MKPANEQLKRVKLAQEAQQMDTNTNPGINPALQARLAVARREIHGNDLNLNGIFIRADDMESIITFLSAHPGVTSLNAYSVRRPRSEQYCMMYSGSISYVTTDGGVVDVPAFLSALQDNPTLTSLGLGFIDNLVPDTHVQALAAFLRTNQHLTHLSLGDNNMENPGALILSKALESNVTLTELNLCRSKIGTNGRAALQQAEDARNEAAEATRTALVEDNNGEPKALLHDFHQCIPDPKVRSLIAEYSKIPRLTIRP